MDAKFKGKFLWGIGYFCALNESPKDCLLFAKEKNNDYTVEKFEWSTFNN